MFYTKDKNGNIIETEETIKIYSLCMNPAAIIDRQVNVCGCKYRSRYSQH